MGHGQSSRGCVQCTYEKGRVDVIWYTLWWTYKKQLNMAIEIVDFPIKNGGSFHGKMLVYQAG